MRGIIKNITDRSYGFIKEVPSGIEYFFHKEDYIGNWNELIFDFQNAKNRKIMLEFDVTESKKGPRAANVKLAD